MQSIEYARYGRDKSDLRKTLGCLSPQEGCPLYNAAFDALTAFVNNPIAYLVETGCTPGIPYWIHLRGGDPKSPMVTSMLSRSSLIMGTVNSCEGHTGWAPVGEIVSDYYAPTEKLILYRDNVDNARDAGLVRFFKELLGCEVESCVGGKMINDIRPVPHLSAERFLLTGGNVSQMNLIRQIKLQLPARAQSQLLRVREFPVEDKLSGMGIPLCDYKETRNPINFEAVDL